MVVFEAKSYVEFLSWALHKGEEKIPRGQVKQMAEKLQCHPTFISQVLTGKAQFNHEQSVRFCTTQQMSFEETEFFLDLLNRDRASTKEAREVFQRIIDRKIRERLSYQSRTKISTTLSREQEVLYLSSWIPSAIHAALHLKGVDSPESVANLLKLDVNKVAESLSSLEKLKLVRKTKNRWKPTELTLHVGKENMLSNSFHSHWRLKTSNELIEKKRKFENIHFSSIFAITEEVADEIREILLKNLQEMRSTFIESPSEKLYTLCLDFYSFSE